MGSFANTLFTLMLGWVSSAAEILWSVFTGGKGSSFAEWFGNNWKTLAAVLCAVGLAADLCVYLFRWRPYRVWKSFFRRRSRQAENEEENPEESVHGETVSESVSYSEKRTMKPAPRPEPDAPEEEDLMRWEPVRKESEPRVDTPTVRLTVTAAGYAVPEDSPYRRPAALQREELSEPEEEPASDPAPARSTVGRRRRRFTVGSLFSSPEEDLYEFDSPQELIDRRQAYRKPVYPTGWKQDGNGEEPE